MTAVDNALEAETPRAQGVARRRWRRAGIPIALQLVALVIGVVIWEILGRLNISILFPPFTDVVSSLWHLLSSGQLSGPLADSFKTFGIGLGISLAIGLTLGVLMGISRPVRVVAGTYVNLIMAIPPVAFIPLLLIWIGPGNEAQTVVVVTFTLPGLVVNTERAITTGDKQRLEMARSFGVGPLGQLLRVRIPDGLPLILAGIRISISRAIKGMVTAEVLIAATGLGGLLENYGTRLDGKNLYAIILAIVMVAVILSELVRYGEKYLLRWQFED